MSAIKDYIQKYSKAPKLNATDIELIDLIETESALTNIKINIRNLGSDDINTSSFYVNFEHHSGDLAMYFYYGNINKAFYLSIDKSYKLNLTNCYIKFENIKETLIYIRNVLTNLPT